LKDAANCLDHIASVTAKCVRSIGRMTTTLRNRKMLAENHVPLLRHSPKLHTDWSGIEPGPRSERPTTNYLSHDMTDSMTAETLDRNAPTGEIQAQTMSTTFFMSSVCQLLFRDCYSLFKLFHISFAIHSKQVRNR